LCITSLPKDMSMQNNRKC